MNLDAQRNQSPRQEGSAEGPIGFTARGVSVGDIEARDDAHDRVRCLGDAATGRGKIVETRVDQISGRLLAQAAAAYILLDKRANHFQSDVRHAWPSLSKYAKRPRQRRGISATSVTGS